MAMMSKKTRLIIKTEKGETISAAEWRYFLDAKLKGKYDPMAVVAAMKDKKNIEEAKKIMSRPAKLTSEQKALIAYRNSDKFDRETMRLARVESSHDGFMNMNVF